MRNHLVFANIRARTQVSLSEVARTHLTRVRCAGGVSASSRAGGSSETTQGDDLRYGRVRDGCGGTCGRTVRYQDAIRTASRTESAIDEAHSRTRKAAAQARGAAGKIARGRGAAGC